MVDRNQNLKNLEEMLPESEQKDNDSVPTQCLSPNYFQEEFKNIRFNLAQRGTFNFIYPSQNITNQQKGEIDGSFSPMQTTQGKQTMLIVEDNIMIQDVIQNQLKRIRVDFVAAKDGMEAVEIVEDHLKKKKMFDIILMDLYMPNKDGFEASEAIRELEKKYEVSDADRHFICAHSSEITRQNEINCFKYGIDDIVAKPMKLQSLQRMLSEHDRRKVKSPLLSNPSQTVKVN